jgi:hypothetical protein
MGSRSGKSHVHGEVVAVHAQVYATATGIGLGLHKELREECDPLLSSAAERMIRISKFTPSIDGRSFYLVLFSSGRS